MAADNQNTKSMGMDPDLVERRSFDAGFRGFDQHQVRRYLGEVAAELRAAAEREQALINHEEALTEQLHIAEVRAEESASQVAEFELGKLDDDRLSELVGAETTRVLSAAREAAREIMARAEEQRADLIAEAEAESESIRSRAEGLLAERHAEAEAQASEILTASEQRRTDAEAEATQIRIDAEAEARSYVEDARGEGLRIVAEARVVREKILRDMARRRNVGRQQVERLRAGRDRLLETYEFVRSSLDDVTAELEGVLPEAKVSADRAAGRIDLDVVPASAELEHDVAEAYELGLIDSHEVDAEAARQLHDAEGNSEDEDDDEEGENAPTTESEVIDLTTVENVGGSEESDADDADGQVPADDLDSGRSDADDPDADQSDSEDDEADAGSLIPASSVPQPGSSPMGLTGDAAASSRSRRRRELVDDVELPELTDDSAFESVRIIGPDPASRAKAADDDLPEADGNEPAEKEIVGDKRAGDQPAALDVPRSSKPGAKSKPSPMKSIPKPSPMPARRTKPVSRPVVTTPSERTPARASQALSGQTAEVLEFRGRTSRRSNARVEPASDAADEQGNDETTIEQSAEPDAPVAKVRSADPVSPTADDVGVEPETSHDQSTATSDDTSRSKSPTPTAATPAADVAPPEAEPPSVDVGSTKPARTKATPGASTVEDVLARLRSGAVGDQDQNDDKSEATAKAKNDTEAEGAAGKAVSKPRAKAKKAASVVAESEETPDGVPDETADGDFDDRPKPVDAGDPAIIGSRDELTVPLAKDLARKLKRVLSDDQNELLTEIRSRGVKNPLTPEDVGVAEEMVDRYRGAAMEGLTAAADAGTTFLGKGSSRQSRDGVGDLASELAESIALPLNDRLVRGLDAGDADSVDARLRAAFREVRTSQINTLVDHAVLAAFNRGRLTSLDSKSAVRWVFDTGSTSPCPDCHDNALAGGQPVGEAFPTGHAHPPIHAGCRCLVVPVKA